MTALNVIASRRRATLVALLAREVELMITPPPILIPQAKAGRVRLLAVSSAFRERLAADAVVAGSCSPQELMAFIRSEIPKFAQVIRSAGIKPD
jgi:tripartite-type tricarboxylate transporter receptor subunit TctC